MKSIRITGWWCRPRSVAAWEWLSSSHSKESGTKLRRAWLAAAVMLLGWGAAGAVEIPAPALLEARAGVRRETLNVVEPHESQGEHRVLIAYRGFPLNALLDHWFGQDWRARGAEIVFHALDGYRSVIAGSQLQRYRAVLAFERADGQAFVVNNPAQQQSRVPLGPYYLVWDNRFEPELQASGSRGWPYQVTRIELTDSAQDEALLPHGVSAEIHAGFTATKDHCLTCHRIRGIGGGKYPTGLEQAVCGWADERLKQFIDNPARFRPGTPMPALGGSDDPALRQRTIDGIVSYLHAVKDADAACAPVSSGP